MLRHRSTATKWMDDAAATEAAFGAALTDLARINRMSLAYRPMLRWLDRLVARTGATRLSVLDVGAGGGDMLRAIARWAAQRGVVVGLAVIELALRERPVVVPIAVHEEHLQRSLRTATPDDAAGGFDHDRQPTRVVPVRRGLRSSTPRRR